MSRSIRFLPLVVLALLVAAMIWRLATPISTSVTSTLVGKPLPAFVVGPAVPGSAGLDSRALADGRPHLINIFASWCVPCATEVGVLGELKGRGFAVDGLAIRDKPDDLARFLARYGNPYEAIGADPQSRVQIALGSSGVPESFIVDGRGIVRAQHIGPIEASDLDAVVRQLELAR